MIRSDAYHVRSTARPPRPGSVLKSCSRCASLRTPAAAVDALARSASRIELCGTLRNLSSSGRASSRVSVRSAAARTALRYFCSSNCRRRFTASVWKKCSTFAIGNAPSASCGRLLSFSCSFRKSVTRHCALCRSAPIVVVS
eukprot:1099618-Prymnesium_polylepis.1